MLPKDWRKQLQAAYPKRRGQGWVNVGRQIEQHLKNGENWEEMLEGADNYRKVCAEEKTEPQFIKMAQTFFGPGLWWTEYLDMEPLENELTLDDEAAKLGLIRQENESDESLKSRMGVAETKKRYGM